MAGCKVKPVINGFESLKMSLELFAIKSVLIFFLFQTFYDAINFELMSLDFKVALFPLFPFLARDFIEKRIIDTEWRKIIDINSSVVFNLGCSVSQTEYIRNPIHSKCLELTVGLPVGFCILS